MGVLRCIYGVGVFVLCGFVILHFATLLFTSYTRRRCKVGVFLGQPKQSEYFFYGLRNLRLLNYTTALYGLVWHETGKGLTCL